MNIVRCAQSRAALATPLKIGRERTPTLVLCSRNARPQKGRRRESWHSLCARRGPTINQWSLDARSGDYASPLAENG